MPRAGVRMSGRLFMTFSRLAFSLCRSTDAKCSPFHETHHKHRLCVGEHEYPLCFSTQPPLLRMHAK